MGLQVDGMIDKQEFYRGAAIMRLIADGRAAAIRAQGGGFVIDDESYVLIKFSTKSSSPWRFTFTDIELRQIDEERESRVVFLALVCGGDGICAIPWDVLEPILGEGRLWVSCSRRFHERYVVAGATGALKNRVPHNRWPSIIFNGELDSDR